VHEGDLLPEHSVAHATHTGEFQDLQPSGKRVMWTENNIYWIEDGRLAEVWNCCDLLAIMYQIDIK
jgi:predicted ester cyclase